MIILTRAVAASEVSLTVSAIRNDSEPFMPDARLFQYEHEGHGPNGDKWFYDDFRMSIQSVIFAHEIGGPDRPSSYVYLSADGEVHHAARPEQYTEIIPETGADKVGNKFYAYVNKLRQIGSRLYACGAGGQIFIRAARDNWHMLTDAVLFD
ncbi:hypothetical protein, partial [uncultured Roseobacter sp.]|uniref:hypothetical protein n=1 Tax=uncultured Roseobacter sp. TaxID=114847 RepID=UPI002611BC88